jgi:3-oxoisoapionate kinase
MRLLVDQQSLKPHAMPADAAPHALRVAFYGDDFTGSTDTLATLTGAGLRSILFLGVPTDDELAAAGPLDALGIAGAARSMTPAAMREELEPVGAFFASLRVPVIHYKTCSTFDSAPHVGSIGVAVDVLRRVVPNALVPIVGGQPNLGRYCVFGNLFAAAEAGGAIVRIDRHPTMSVHPVTPMREADLREHLAAQGLARVVNVDYTTYDRAEEWQDASLDGIADGRPGAVLFDVGHATHLPAVGRIVWQRSAPARAGGSRTGARSGVRRAARAAVARGAAQARRHRRWRHLQSCREGARHLGLVASGQPRAWRGALPRALARRAARRHRIHAEGRTDGPGRSVRATGPR